uniref:Uncharacterized protein n=1 Tax=Romanomermis culicivorax TaxID=13658 RepID=A0A915KFL4_ROMCU
MTAIMVVCYLVLTAPSAFLHAVILFYPAVQSWKCDTTGIDTIDLCWRKIGHFASNIFSI